MVPPGRLDHGAGGSPTQVQLRYHPRHPTYARPVPCPVLTECVAEPGSTTARHVRFHRKRARGCKGPKGSICLHAYGHGVGSRG
eukprot:3566483-Rhodomonas_salina.2